MMKKQEDQVQNASLVQHKIRKAQFVLEESQKREKFKYNVSCILHSIYAKRLPNLKRYINSKIQKPSLWASKVDWKTVREDSRDWLLEALIEGAVVNFALWALFSVALNPLTILAYGIVIKEGINIYWRLRHDGNNPKIPQKEY